MVGGHTERGGMVGGHTERGVWWGVDIQRGGYGGWTHREGGMVGGHTEGVRVGTQTWSVRNCLIMSTVSPLVSLCTEYLQQSVCVYIHRGFQVG